VNEPPYFLLPLLVFLAGLPKQNKANPSHYHNKFAGQNRQKPSASALVNKPIGLGWFYSSYVDPIRFLSFESTETRRLFQSATAARFELRRLGIICC